MKNDVFINVTKFMKEYMASNGRKILNDEVKIKENSTVYNRELYHHFPGSDKKNHETSVRIADFCKETLSSAPLENEAEFNNVLSELHA
jgi:hypothetical protein